MKSDRWPSVPVRRLGTVVGGGTPTADSAHWDGGIPFVTPPDLRPVVGGVVHTTQRTLTAEGVAAGSSIVPEGSVLLSIRAPIGYVARTSSAMAFNQGCRAIVPFGGTSAHYLTYALVAAGAELASLGRGTTFMELSAAQMAALELPVPSLEEQRAIADYLDRETGRIDNLIEEQQRLIEMLRERRAAVVSSAVTPTDSWVCHRIKHIGKTSLGKMLDAGRAVRDGDQPKPYVRAADVRADGSVNLVDLNEMPFSDAEMKVFDLRAGDVLLIEGGATVGRPGFMFEPAPGIAFQKTVNRLRVGPETDARFVYWSMLRLYESAYYANHYGSVSFVHLTGEKLREIELHLPLLDEQRAIATYLDEQTARIDALIAETERFVELARERRSALIAATVTGQIDVREMA
ncbi:restriction endonuclease subunit S [Amycolatopsis magusensis]|nr:restriction endonuclease subunit S [Amycolatopsis magusensis]